MKPSLFRSIRHKLLLRRQGSEGQVNEGKLSRYLTYAVGEVVLIIVGILLSLKIYDYNEDRKAQAEFEVYKLQLKDNVRDAIKDTTSSKAGIEKFAADCEYVLEFLVSSSAESEDLATFEFGLNRLGSYTEFQVKVGLLGDLFDGNFDTIGRDPKLALRAREMESKLEGYLENADHIYHQIDLASDRLNLYRGKGDAGSGLPPEYNLQTLKSSEEFRYTTLTIVGRLRRLVRLSGYVEAELEDFLAALEENE